MDAGRDPQDWQGPRGCGNRREAFYFFYIFQILLSQIYLNLIIAIIVDGFSGASEADKLPVNEDFIGDFEMCWSKYDPEATYFISIEDLDYVLIDLAKSENCSDLFMYKKGVFESKIYRDRLIA